MIILIHLVIDIQTTLVAVRDNLIINWYDRHVSRHYLTRGLTSHRLSPWARTLLRMEGKMSRCHADRKCKNIWSAKNIWTAKKYLERCVMFVLRVSAGDCEEERDWRGWSEQETEGRQGTRGNIVITERILGVQGDLWRNNWFWWFTMRMLSNYIFRVLGLCIEIFAAKNKRRSCKIVDIYLIKT